MRRILIATFLGCLLLAACGEDPMVEINQLVAEKKIAQAKNQYKQLVEDKNNPNLERDYIFFLYKHQQYNDFRKQVASFLNRYPEDGQVKKLQFEFYAKLATDSIRDERFEDALNYIVSKLLSPDFADYRQWEKRQQDVLQSWFQHAAEKGDESAQKEVLVNMKNLGFENMAKSLAPDLYEEATSVEEDGQ